MFSSRLGPSRPGHERVAKEISDLGAGPIRTYRGMRMTRLPAMQAEGFDTVLHGAELVLDPAEVRRQYPFIKDTAIAMLHVRRCGWLSAQQLGMYLLQQAKGAGANTLWDGYPVWCRKGRNRVRSGDWGKRTVGDFHTIVCDRCRASSQGGGSPAGDGPSVLNELHGKIAFNDPMGSSLERSPS